MVATIPSTPAAYQEARAVTPNDSTDLSEPATGLLVTAVGNVSFVCGGQTVNLNAVPANTILPFRVSRVRSTGTTATVLALA